MFLYILVSILSDSVMTLQEIFLASMLFEIIKIPILGATPIAIVDITEIRITVQRIEAFLLCDNNSNCIRYSIQPKSIPRNFPKTISNKSISIISTEMKREVEIFAKRVTVKWNPSAANNILDNINFKAKSGELVAFVGPTGSGKSTIFYAILKEIRLLRGELSVTGTVSYAPQEPWIFSASIKQNILFGSEMNQKKYCQVIKVCALEHDLSLLPNGDFTVVGERGVMLSGGQKARISLARAVYKEANIYLLDDPLSAVDSNVGKNIFTECIRNYLKDKCVLLITHQVQHLKKVKNIYVLEQGKIVANGNFKQLNNIKLSEDIYQEEVGSDLVDPKILTTKKIKDPAPSTNRVSASYGTKNSYKSYLADDGNWIFTCIIFFLSVCLQIIGGCTDYIIIFGNDLKPEKNTLMEYKNYTNSSNINFYTYDQKARKFLINYGILVTVLTVLTLLRSWLFVKLCKRASKNLHNKTFLRIIHGTMKFFNAHHSGEILNRFSRDIGLIDESLPFILMDVIHTLFSIISTMILISVLNIWLVIPMIITIILFCLYGIMFIPIGRNINKLEGASKTLHNFQNNFYRVVISARNPVCNHLSSSLQGLATIRAFKAQEILIQEFNKHQDMHTAVFYKLVAFYNTLRFWVDTTCVLYFALVIFSFFIFKGKFL
jgi:ATP-binding cassette subfamily C (CFTR/MRP) protein 4